jgi:serine/threonine protein kinase
MFENMQVEGYDLIFMELCKGGDLLHYVRKRRKLDELTAKVLFKQIILGL